MKIGHNNKNNSSKHFEKTFYPDIVQVNNGKTNLSNKMFKAFSSQSKESIPNTPLSQFQIYPIMIVQAK